MNFRRTVDIVIDEDGIYLPIQGDVEDIAIETVGTHRQIYFKPIPITKELQLEFCEKGWKISVRRQK